MLIEQNVLFIDDPVVVVVSKQPVMELAAASDFFQKVCQIVRLEAGVDFLLNYRRRTVRNDVVNLPVQSFQRLPGFGIFLVRRQFFLPP